MEFMGQVAVKSTLLNIISLQAQFGKGFINNKEIKSVDISNLTNLSFASQITILDDNILVNITLDFHHNDEKLEI